MQQRMKERGIHLDTENKFFKWKQETNHELHDLRQQVNTCTFLAQEHISLDLILLCTSWSVSVWQLSPPSYHCHHAPYLDLISPSLFFAREQLTRDRCIVSTGDDMYRCNSTDRTMPVTCLHVHLWKSWRSKWLRPSLLASTRLRQRDATSIISEWG